MAKHDGRISRSLDKTPDTPESIAWRQRDNEVRRLARIECQRIWPYISTDDQARDSMAWFEARVTQLHTEAQ